MHGSLGSVHSKWHGYAHWAKMSKVYPRLLGGLMTNPSNHGGGCWGLWGKAGHLGVIQGLLDHTPYHTPSWMHLEL